MAHIIHCKTTTPSPKFMYLVSVGAFVYLFFADSTNSISSRKLKKKNLMFLAASLIIASRFLISHF